MIGVAKNQSVSMFARMSRMSRKCTVSADRISASADVNTSWTSTATGNHSRSSGAGQLVIVDQERDQDRQPEEEVHHVRQHADDRQHLGREQHLLDQVAAGISEPAASDSDDENQVHGRMPQNMNSGVRLHALGRVRHHDREDERVDRAAAAAG